MAQHGMLDTIAESLAQLFLPLEDQTRASGIRLLLAELGLQFPSSINANADLVAVMQSTVQQIQHIPPIPTAFADAARNANLPRLIPNTLSLPTQLSAPSLNMQKERD